MTCQDKVYLDDVTVFIKGNSKYFNALLTALLPASSSHVHLLFYIVCYGVNVNPHCGRKYVLAGVPRC